jgi:hypothetical protein
VITRRRAGDIGTSGGHAADGTASCGSDRSSSLVGEGAFAAWPASHLRREARLYHELISEAFIEPFGDRVPVCAGDLRREAR